LVSNPEPASDYSSFVRALLPLIAVADFMSVACSPVTGKSIVCGTGSMTKIHFYLFNLDGNVVKVD
jgi:hypothetical protein